MNKDLPLTKYSKSCDESFSLLECRFIAKKSKLMSLKLEKLESFKFLFADGSFNGINFTVNGIKAKMLVHFLYKIRNFPISNIITLIIKMYFLTARVAVDYSLEILIGLTLLIILLNVFT